MLSVISTVLFIVVGVINALPMLGVLGVAQLESLYGVPLNDPNLILLMRHRAVLFGIVGGILIYAAFNPIFRTLATVVGLVSMMAFVLLMLPETGLNSQLRTIFNIDLVASAALLVAYGLTRLK